MELKKSYKGFVIWMIGFCVCCVAIAFIEVEDIAFVIRLIMNMVTCSVALLSYMIYRNGYVYWYSGITYEDAARAGEERRKAYAFKHWKLFGVFAGGFLLFSVIMHLLQLSHWIDFAVGTVGIIIVAVRTIWYKL